MEIESLMSGASSTFASGNSSQVFNRFKTKDTTSLGDNLTEQLGKLSEVNDISEGPDRISRPLNVNLGTENAPSFGEIFSTMVEKVDEKEKIYQGEVRKVLAGESDNLHQAMIAGKESKVYFELMLETTKTLREGFQEIMRMSV